MELLHYEDLPVGRVFDCGTYRVTKDEILEFARQFDPQPHHLDEEAGRKSILGGLAASGWHVCAIAMRLFAEGVVLKAAGVIAQVSDASGPQGVRARIQREGEQEEQREPCVLRAHDESSLSGVARLDGADSDRAGS